MLCVAVAIKLTIVKYRCFVYKDCVEMGFADVYYLAKSPCPIGKVAVIGSVDRVCAY